MSEIYDSLREVASQRKGRASSAPDKKSTTETREESAGLKKNGNVNDHSVNRRLAGVAVLPAHGDKKLILLFSIVILIMLAINIATLISLIRYASGRNALLKQINEFQTTLISSRQEINTLVAGIKKDKADFDRVNLRLEEVNAKLGLLERQTNANTSETNAFNREMSRLVDKVNKLDAKVEELIGPSGKKAKKK
jgi:hypothetical protein